MVVSLIDTDGEFMAIVVQCECGRTLRAPDQMAGKSAHCVCGNQVRLPQDRGPSADEVLEPEFAEPDLDSDQAPILLARPRDRERSRKEKRSTSIFRPSQGRNVERGESDEDIHPSPPPRRKKKKRRQDVTTSTERKRLGRETFTAGVSRSLKFPFRPESILTVLVMALAYGAFTAFSRFLPYGILGFKAFATLFIGSTVILGYFLYFLLQIFRLAIVDEDDLPLTMEFDAELIRQDIWLWLGSLWWTSLPLAAFWWLSARLVSWRIVHAGDWFYWGVGLIGGLCLAMFPMALMSAVLHQAVLAANPWTVFRTIIRVPLEYLAVSGLFGTLLATTLLAGSLIPSYPPVIPILSEFVMWIIFFFALEATAYGMGNFYYRNRHKIDWFRDTPKML